MLKSSFTEAVFSLREVTSNLPPEAEARSEFFVQWRTRSIETLERLFPGDPEPARMFKELEFSPRLIAKNDAREEQLKLDAYLAGCAATRALIESLIQRVTTRAPEPAPIMQSQLQGEAQTPAVMVDATPAAVSDGVISGASMDTLELCAPVRSSLSRVLGAWDKGDRDMALVLSAQLLAELTVLSRDDRFRGAFERVVNSAFDNVATDAVKASAPKCMWSFVAAMNEVMKA